MSKSFNRVLILGGSGLAGSALIQEYVAAKYDVAATFSSLAPPCSSVEWFPFTVTEASNLTASRLQRILECFRPHLVVNCLRTDDVALMPAAYGLVSLVLATAGFPTIYLSTNAVFQPAAIPHRPTHPINPMTTYEWAKALGERPDSQLVIRTTFVGRNCFTGVLPFYRLADPENPVWWNGVTNLELARFIVHSYTPEKGLLHLASPAAMLWNDVVTRLFPEARFQPENPSTTGTRLLTGGRFTERSLEDQLAELSRSIT